MEFELSSTDNNRIKKFDKQFKELLKSDDI